MGCYALYFVSISLRSCILNSVFLHLLALRQDRFPVVSVSGWPKSNALQPPPSVPMQLFGVDEDELFGAAFDAIRRGAGNRDNRHQLLSQSEASSKYDHIQLNASDLCGNSGFSEWLAGSDD